MSKELTVVFVGLSLCVLIVVVEVCVLSNKTSHVVSQTTSLSDFDVKVKDDVSLKEQVLDVVPSNENKNDPVDKKQPVVPSASEDSSNVWENVPSWVQHFSESAEKNGIPPRSVQSAKEGSQMWTVLFGDPKRIIVVFSEKKLKRLYSCTVIFMCKNEKEVEVAIKQWNALVDTVSEVVEIDQKIQFVKWGQSMLVGLDERHKTVSSYYVEEEFGSKVARFGSCLSDVTGLWVTLHLSEGYLPSEGKPVTSWGDMRKGMTLDEVEFFAGKGKIQMSSGDAKQYIWNGGAWVIFKRGRVESWTAPYQFLIKGKNEAK